jgi:hypothetical protein
VLVTKWLFDEMFESDDFCKDAPNGFRYPSSLVDRAKPSSQKNGFALDFQDRCCTLCWAVFRKATYP